MCVRVRTRACACVCVCLCQQLLGNPSPAILPTCRILSQPKVRTHSTVSDFPLVLSSEDSRPGFGWSMDKRPFENSSLVINMGSEVEMG